MKRILTGAALNSHLVRVWATIKKRCEHSGSSINYMAHALIVAVQWGEYMTKEQQIQLASLLAGELLVLLPQDSDLPVVIRYLDSRGWEKPGEGLIYEEDDPDELIYASTITSLFADHGLMPLRWGPTTWFRRDN